MTFSGIPESRVFFQEQCASTNDIVFELLPQHAGAIVWTLNQTHGRGSRGRQWISNQGSGLAFSIGWSQAPLPSEFPFPLFAGVVLYKTLIASFPQLAGSLWLKWPNDLVCQGRKLCGILCESRWLGTDKVQTVLGLGINLKNDTIYQSIEKPWTTLENEGIRMVPHEFVNQLVGEFSAGTQLTPDQVCAQWEEGCQWKRGTYLEVQNDGSWLGGHYLGLSPQGGIRIRDAAGKETVIIQAETDFMVVNGRR